MEKFENGRLRIYGFEKFSGMILLLINVDLDEIKSEFVKT